MTFDPTRRARESDHEAIERDLAELCRRHGVGLELIRDSRDIDDLIERVIGDYESRRAGDSNDGHSPDDINGERARHDLRGIVAFACRASLLRERAATSLRTRVIGADSRVPDSPAAKIEKLDELLGTLGALIHKINNPLTALVGRAQLLRMQGELPPRVVRGAEVIEESSRRIADLTKELATRVREGRRLAGHEGEDVVPASTIEPTS